MRDVEAVVEDLADHGEAGLVVAACWYDVSDDRSNYLMSQFDVQNFLWLTLPQLIRVPPADLTPLPDWQTIAGEAAWFFEQLDQPRYAAICRGEQTALILATAEDELECFELYAEATHESGIMPPPGLRITWLDDQGPREIAAYDAITRALERAIVAGELDPSDDRNRLRIAVATLEQPPDGHTETLIDLLFVERLERWRDRCGSQTMRELLVRIGPDVSKPMDLGAELLLTGTRPLSEALHDLDAPAPRLRVAEKFGLVETVEGARTRTEDGDRALAHPVLMFEAICSGLLDGDDRIARQVVAPLLAMLMLADEVDLEMLVERAGMVLYETGWRGDAHNEPMPQETVRATVVSLLDDLHTAGGTTRGETERLTTFGERVVWAAIRTRALQGGVVD
jgi:hypothetical protein